MRERGRQRRSRRALALDGRGRAAIALLVLAAGVTAAGCVGADDREQRALQRWVDRDAAGFAAERPAARPSSEPAADAPVRPDATPVESPELQAMTAYAMAHHPRVKAAFEQWRAALAQVPQARALMDPQLAYTHYVQEMMAEQAVGLRQTLEWPGKLEARGEQATAAARAAEQQFEAARLAVRYGVAEAWAEWVYTERAMAVVQRNVDILEQWVGVAEAALEVGRRPLADVSRAQVELGETEDELASLQRRQSAAAGRLNAALGRRSDAPLPSVEQASESALAADGPTFELAADERELLTWAQQRNLDVAAETERIMQRRAAVRLARLNRVPDVTLGLSYQESAVPGRDDAVGLSAGLNLPIWAESLDAERAEALAAYGAAQHRRTERLQEVEAAVRTAYWNYEDATRRATLYREQLIPQARRSLEAAEAAYGEGESGYDAMTDAQRTLQALQLTLERARMQRLQQAAELEMLIGRRLIGEPADQQQAETERDEEGRNR